MDAARRVDRAPRAGRQFPFMLSVVAVMLLAGPRETEAYQLRVGDIDFDRGLIRVRKARQYGGRKSDDRLKTPGSYRWIPLWPQLRVILVPHIASLPNQDANAYLFPADASGTRRIRNVRGTFTRIVKEAGLAEKGVGFRTLRHTYGSMRIQTLDGGEPVAMYTVARELGHKSIQLLEKRYAHLLKDRHRAEVVEYPVLDP